MTARQPQQPRRTRRRTATPGSTLPRPVASDGLALRSAAAAPPRPSTRTREHHVEEDFSYVRKDLGLVAVVAAITMAFVVVLSFVVS